MTAAADTHCTPVTFIPSSDDGNGTLDPGETWLYTCSTALTTDTTNTATVTAIEPCELLAIDRRDLVAFLKRNPDVAIGMMQVLAARVAQLSEWVEDTLFLNLPLRLAKKLLALASGASSIRFRMPLVVTPT